MEYSTLDSFILLRTLLNSFSVEVKFEFESQDATTFLSCLELYSTQNYSTFALNGVHGSKTSIYNLNLKSRPSNVLSLLHPILSSSDWLLIYTKGVSSMLCHTSALSLLIRGRPQATGYCYVKKLSSPCLATRYPFIPR